MIRLAARAAWIPLLLLLPLSASGQDANILEPVGEIEALLKESNYEIVTMAGARFPGDRTFATTLRLGEGKMVRVQWAPAPKSGGEFNNEPRYEIAAYELQKLFLEESEYVVPPTVGRCVPFGDYPQHENRPPIPPTFDEWHAVLVVLQYWLWNVDVFDRYDRDRFQDDPLYARHLANFNIFTYLARHADSNEGNYLISADVSSPRVFSVDNGITFASEESNRGHEWRDIRIDRLPRSTVERLRTLDSETLGQALGVVAQFELQGGRLVPVEATQNLDSRRGIRLEGSVLQLGLTENEIQRVHERLQRLLERVDSGRYELF